MLHPKGVEILLLVPGSGCELQSEKSSGYTVPKLSYFGLLSGVQTARTSVPGPE